MEERICALAPARIGIARDVVEKQSAADAAERLGEAQGGHERLEQEGIIGRRGRHGQGNRDRVRGLAGDLAEGPAPAIGGDGGVGSSI